MLTGTAIQRMDHAGVDDLKAAAAFFTESGWRIG
jgi:hypothetical protein